MMQMSEQSSHAGPEDEELLADEELELLDMDELELLDELDDEELLNELEELDELLLDDELELLDDELLDEPMPPVELEDELVGTFLRRMTSWSSPTSTA